MLTDRHLTEWRSSCVEDSIIHQNVCSLHGTIAIHRILGDTQVTKKTLTQYRNLSAGGWWVNGVDPLNNWEAMRWGQFKPNLPRINDEGDIIKYESPLNTQARAIFLRTDDPDYWKIVAADRSIPIALLEGAKKAGALISILNLPSIALPGIWMGRRTHKNIYGRTDRDWLIAEMEPFIQPGRLFIFAFDQDVKYTTRQQVKKATEATAALLCFRGCKVANAIWHPEQGKGIDDVAKECGTQAVENIFNTLQYLIPQPNSKTKRRDRQQYESV